MQHLRRISRERPRLAQGPLMPSVELSALLFLVRFMGAKGKIPTSE